MKFGKSLFQVIELSDPEWGPYWINYKYLKQKINEIVCEQQESLQQEQQQQNAQSSSENETSSPSSRHKSNPNLISSKKILKQQLSQSTAEVEFFKLLKMELKKISEFFYITSEILCKIRQERLINSLKLLKHHHQQQQQQQQHGNGSHSKSEEKHNKQIAADLNSWTRLMASCVRFYKDVLLLENYAIMNYCGFSKILKKHDKRTGYSTRDAFMIKVMSKQNFTQYPYLVKQLKEVEAIFEEIQKLHSLKPILEEERIFIAAIRDLNYQASQLQNEENSSVQINLVESNELPFQDASSNRQVEQSFPFSDSLSDKGDVKTRSEALFEASVRAVVTDPAPNMQSILTWMHSVSTPAALIPIPATTPYLTQSASSTSLSLPQYSTKSSSRKHRLSRDENDEEEDEDEENRTPKRPTLDKSITSETNRTPSLNDSLCTEGQSLPDESFNENEE